MVNRVVFMFEENFHMKDISLIVTSIARGFVRSNSDGFIAARLNPKKQMKIMIIHILISLISETIELLLWSDSLY